MNTNNKETAQPTDERHSSTHGAMNANRQETAQPTDERHSSSHGAMKNPTQPSGQRRSLCHDYYAPGTYMLTIVTEERVRLLGHIEGTARNRAMGQLPHMVLSALGRRVLEEEIPKIPRLYPNVEVWRVAFMPDHIHLLVRVTAPFPKGKRLLREAEEGTVLVTPGISKGEHLVADAAIDGQLSLIILQNRLFGPYWKPEQRR